MRNQKGQFLPDNKEAKGGPLGNRHATKLKDEGLKKEAYRQYCQHISLGRTKKSWTFVHPEDPLKSLTSKTMEKYLHANPLEFPSILMDVAQAQSLAVWEAEGLKLMRGQYRNGSPETWKTFMRNLHGWDKDSSDETASCSADKILDMINDRS